MRRRQVILALAGAAACPLAARAQQSERMRRIGVLFSIAKDVEGEARVAAFRDGLAKLGWIEDRNVHIDYRWGAADPERLRRYAAELASATPDVILASSNSALAALHRATREVPIVFAQVPIRSVAVSSRAWRGRAATSPALRPTNTPLAPNGWSCSRKSRRGSLAWRSFTTRRIRIGPDICVRSRQRRHRWASSRLPLPCATRKQSRAPSMPAASTKNPFTERPSDSLMVPIDSGGGIAATNWPKADAARLQISSAMALPWPASTRSMPGFVETKTFTAEDGERATIVTFADPDSHRAWREHPRHREAKRHGAESYYSEYSIAVGETTYASSFERPT